VQTILQVFDNKIMSQILVGCRVRCQSNQTMIFAKVEDVAKQQLGDLQGDQSKE
jgi:hypothetical protein